MARVEIRHKCIMVAREAARRDSRARETGRSVFIKRYYGNYKLLAVEVSEKQRSCRDLFADAQKLASKEMKMWNKKRHWERMAKRHKVHGAHRMAVSWFYKLLKDNDGRLDVALSGKADREMKVLSINKRRTKERTKEYREQSFLYKKFGDIEEYYDIAIRPAS
ncbi:MAG: hypothetical protein MJZ31_13115 [Bacteroidales bacterium]|nr:hypothetical protein [Bacteroidales bacterium]